MLTEAQRCYLRLAQALEGLSCDAIAPGSSYRCVLRLTDRGLLEKRFIPMIGPTYFITDAGKIALLGRV